MIIIVEGPDGSGKSTLAEKLSKQTGYFIVHRSAPKSDEEKAMMMQMYKQAILDATDIILDRCWYSEMVYGPVMRDASVISLEEMYKLELDLCSVGAMIIYCTGSKRTLWERCKKRGEDYVTSYEQFEALYDRYERLMLNTQHLVPVVTYVYKDL